MMISVAVPINSKYHQDFRSVHHSKNLVIFLFTLKLYNYWAQKERLKLKGVRKIVIELAEFDNPSFLPPGTELGAITVMSTRFNFEHFLSLDTEKKKRLYFVDHYQSAIEALCERMEWNEGPFKRISAETRSCLELEVYPSDFEPDRIFI